MIDTTTTDASTNASTNASTTMLIANKITAALRMFNIDALRVLISVTWWYAWVGLRITKIFEFMFRLVLSLPDRLIKLPSILNKPIYNTIGHRVNILNAYNETGEITNKLKLFLQQYWRPADGETTETNGFDFHQFCKMLNCSILFCSYALHDKPSDKASDKATIQQVPPIEHLLVLKEDTNKRVLRGQSIDSSLHEILFGHVDLEQTDDISEAKIPDITAHIARNRKSAVRNIIDNIENKA